MKIIITKVTEARETMQIKDLVLLIKHTLSNYHVMPLDTALGFDMVNNHLPLMLEIPKGNSFCLRRIRYNLKFEVEELKE